MIKILIVLAIVGARDTEQQRFDRTLKYNSSAGYKLVIETMDGDTIIRNLNTMSVDAGVLSVGCSLSGVRIRSMTLVDDENYSIKTVKRPSYAGMKIKRTEVSCEQATLYFIDRCNHGDCCPENYHLAYTV